MKMIEAILRPNKIEQTLESLQSSGFYAATRISVLGRGKQLGLKMGDVYYDEIPKDVLMMVVEDNQVQPVIAIIEKENRTSGEGLFGDGKIFVKPVEQSITISSGQQGL
ncbi:MULTISPECIES: P-II family nitrogen regulator [Bifidobacterium]|jgi:nitrogen regulatory protein PII 1|uniref:Nitrogen fixation nifHD region glnB 1 n=1 Tax=Bifidobacterium subtile TaxID=77635 RepID=A0A087EAJ7_9BIFI|nr:MULTISPECIES: P-II family nitrogen regulator [Bifidobacterium]KFJ04798.1 nitrogen fixation nifHD region glnB 1 [Bifidobacterium subtile]MCI1673624.1 P-II family nitrogen regulator [Bifidobacterium tibiigranuli]MCI1713781.1 P-II family nitrogen regulator [Bifidobacterium tibiigranuli]MCI1834587.1 P-II family nitrogen regulator [Bifidobacterium tibiigranuli]QOL35869.1 P-II family nitrogen regulator [Bifidobacterium subtile]